MTPTVGVLLMRSLEACFYSQRIGGPGGPRPGGPHSDERVARRVAGEQAGGRYPTRIRVSDFSRTIVHRTGQSRIFFWGRYFDIAADAWPGGYLEIG